MTTTTSLKRGDKVKAFTGRSDNPHHFVGVVEAIKPGPRGDYVAIKDSAGVVTSVRPARVTKV